jgi:hypothetical protein
MSILQEIRNKLKKFHVEHRGQQPIIRIDNVTEWEFIELAVSEIGEKATSAIFQYGPRVLSSIYGVRILWNSSKFDVVPESSTELQNWMTQESKMSSQSIPRVGVPRS